MVKNMSLQDTIKAEKQRLQDVLDAVCDPGARMVIQFDPAYMSTPSLSFDVDGFSVLRAMPQVDARGVVKLWLFDLLFREVGYDQGMQFVHMITKAHVTKVHKSQDGKPYAARLVDKYGNEYTVNVIEPEIDPDAKSVFEQWRAQKAADQEGYEATERQLIEEYTRMAEADDGVSEIDDDVEEEIDDEPLEAVAELDTPESDEDRLSTQAVAGSENSGKKKLLYMIQNKLVASNPPRYQPVGVWCIDPADTFALEIQMLPEFPDEQEEADWIINRLVELQETPVLDRSFLEFHKQSMSPYTGVMSDIRKTTNYANSNALVAHILQKIKEGEIR